MAMRRMSQWLIASICEWLALLLTLLWPLQVFQLLLLRLLLRPRLLLLPLLCTQLPGKLHINSERILSPWAVVTFTVIRTFLLLPCCLKLLMQQLLLVLGGVLLWLLQQPCCKQRLHTQLVLLQLPRCP